MMPTFQLGCFMLSQRSEAKQGALFQDLVEKQLLEKQ